MRNIVKHNGLQVADYIKVKNSTGYHSTNSELVTQEGEKFGPTSGRASFIPPVYGEVFRVDRFQKMEKWPERGVILTVLKDFSGRIYPMTFPRLSADYEILSAKELQRYLKLEASDKGLDVSGVRIKEPGAAFPYTPKAFPLNFKTVEYLAARDALVDAYGNVLYSKGVFAEVIEPYESTTEGKEPDQDVEGMLDIMRAGKDDEADIMEKFSYIMARALKLITQKDPFILAVDVAYLLAMERTGLISINKETANSLDLAEAVGAIWITAKGLRFLDRHEGGEK